MGHDAEVQEGLLREVLGISKAQKVLFMENRLEDLLDGQSRREALLASLSNAVDCKKEPYSSIINEIVANDMVLALGIEAMRDDVGSKMKRIKSGVKAMKAYGAG